MKNYTPKLFTLPNELCLLLDTEKNQSGRVAEVLREYYEDKSSLGSLNTRLTKLEDKLELVRRDISEIKQLAGG